MFSHKNKKGVSVYPGNTTSYLDKSNPYIIIDQTDDEQSDTESQIAPPATSSLHSASPLNGSNTNVVYLPEDLLQKAQLLEENNCPVRSIIMIDIVMSCLYFFDGFIGGLLCFFISTNGYLATIYYKRSLMICYLVYQYFQVFLRLATAITIVTIPRQHDYNNTVDDRNQPIDEYFLNTGVYFLLFFCQTCIACFITKYYKLLPNDNERQRIKLYQRGAI